MRTITKPVYLYDELETEEAKQTAREWFCAGYPESDWYSYIFEDATNIGLKIKHFNLDRIKADFFESAFKTASKIVLEHGIRCETWKTASDFLVENQKIRAENEDLDCDNNLSYEGEKAVEQAEEDFLKSLSEDYLILLNSEYENLLSAETVAENIRINEYEFYADGKRACE